MRVIKFRGKSSYHGEWVYGNLIVGKNGKKYVVESDYFEEDGHHLACNSDTPVFTIQETVDQFTGSLDKNGIEIYEGDIIECKNYYGKVKGKIVFEDGCWLVDYSKNYNSEFLIDCKNISIVGNIHDNPELV